MIYQILKLVDENSKNNRCKHLIFANLLSDQDQCQNQGQNQCQCQLQCQIQYQNQGQEDCQCQYLVRYQGQWQRSRSRSRSILTPVLHMIISCISFICFQKHILNIYLN